MSTIISLFTYYLIECIAIEKSLEEAKTEEDAQRIIDNFNKLDIREMFINLINEMSEGSFKYMKDNMYEEVMRFRADEQEFLANQICFYYFV